MEKWRDYGDVDPIPHGGTWIMNDGDNCFRVVTIDKIPSYVEEGSYYLRDLYVDISDSWIKWKDVASCADINPETATDDDKVLALIGYYNYLEFGDQHVFTEKEIVEELKKYDIILGGE